MTFRCGDAEDGDGAEEGVGSVGLGDVAGTRGTGSRDCLPDGTLGSGFEGTGGMLFFSVEILVLSAHSRTWCHWCHAACGSATS